MFTALSCIQGYQKRLSCFWKVRLLIVRGQAHPSFHKHSKMSICQSDSNNYVRPHSKHAFPDGQEPWRAPDWPHETWDRRNESSREGPRGPPPPRPPPLGILLSQSLNTDLTWFGGQGFTIGPRPSEFAIYESDKVSITTQKSNMLRVLRYFQRKHCKWSGTTLCSHVEFEIFLAGGGLTRRVTTCWDMKKKICV